MAEGEDDRPQPFEELNKPSSPKRTNEDFNGVDHEVDLISEPDLGLPRRREISRSGQPQDEDTRNHKRDENPFSFKQFLRRDGGARPKTRSTLNMSGRFPDGSRLTRQGAPDVASGLPDFVQDHFFVEQSLRDSNQNRHSSNADISENLPDFTQKGNNTLHDIQSRWSSNAVGQCFPSLPAVNDQLELPSVGKNKKKNGGPSENVLGNALPDFLSDGPMFSSQVNHENSLHVNIEGDRINHSWVSKDDSLSESHSLQAENESLRLQLEEANISLQNYATRFAKLEAELVQRKCKEAEETASLEKMVQQVEKNLQIATQRAVTAESTVTKLKQEIKSMQAVLEMVGTENESLKSGDNHLISIREKARNASEQITAATSSAEFTLKKLLTGVQSLKMVAAYLADIDKIAERGSGDEDQEDVKGS